MTTLCYAYELTLGVLELIGRKGNRDGDERKPFTVYLQPVRKRHMNVYISYTVGIPILYTVAIQEFDHQSCG